MTNAPTSDKPELTPDQRLATKGDVTTWVGASAGTGKTHVLAARVLALMVTGTPPENILCLTYTRAAAAEMANRIHEKLGQWATEKEDLLAPEIFRICGHKATLEQCHEARTLFARVLELPGGLKIQTIHSFCQTLLKRFPLEAGQSPHFQVMDERTTSEFLKSAIDDIMLASTKVPVLGKAFDEIAAISTETRFEKLVQSFLGNRKQLKQLITAYGSEEKLVAAVFKALGVPENETREKIITEATYPQAFDFKSIKTMVGIIQNGSTSEQKIAMKMAPFFAPDGMHDDHFEGYMDGFFTANGSPRKPFFVKKTQAEHPEFLDVYLKEQARLVKIRDRSALLQVAQNTRAMIHLSSAVLYAFTRKKQAYGYLDYDDLVLVAEDLLRRPAVAEWILYKLDGRIDHILVDEAQDTNRVQWQLVEAISHEFTAGVGTRDDLVRTVFAVGDIKQSIYRFQGAEPEQFILARTRAEKRVLDANQNFAHYRLDLSFRSTTAVLASVDAIIAHPDLRPGIAEADEAIRHFANRKGQSGLVELWPAEETEREENPTEGWQLPLEQKYSDKADARLAAKIAHKIQQMTDGNDMLKSKKRPVRYGDILVLLRSRSDFLDHLVRELKLLGVPVAGSDRMVLSEQLVIEDLLAMAKFALLPDDDYTLACILKSPLIGLDEQALFNLSHGRPGSLWQALKANKKHKKTGDYLSTLLGQADFVTPFEFFSGLLTKKQGRLKIVARLGPEVNDPIDEFLALTLEYESAHSPSLQGFVNWFHAAQTEVKRDLERGANEVRIMTIHGAKGLEAPVVFLPDTIHVPKKRPEDLYDLSPDENPAPCPLLVWSARKELDVGPLAAVRQEFDLRLTEEHNRLLYVALTRARDRLYIAGWKNRNSPKSGTWYSTIREVIEATPDFKNVAGETGDQILRFETGQTAKAEQEDREKFVQREAIALKEWITQPADIKAEQSPPALAVKDQKFRSDLNASEARAAVEKGVIVHELLEFLPDLDAKDREQAGLAYIALKAPQLSAQDRSALWTEVKAVLENPEFADIFGPDSQAEVALAGLIDGRPGVRRLDRLVIKKDEVLIVDFKSDAEVPKSQADIPEGYKAQLNEYRTLVKAGFGRDKITTALLWTKDCSLMEYTPGS